MTNQHPITPLPKKLLSEWDKTWHSIVIPTDPRTYSEYMYDQCAQWGADQELEECWRWMRDEGYRETAQLLHSARRPKPPTLKEQALAELEILRGDANAHGLGFDAPAIRRALEELPDD
jgi:hypothetical protein